jgi:hypothetical protein
MPNPSTTSPQGSQQGPDTQTLIALLSSLMPLLQRMQAQSAAPFWPPDQFPFGQGNFGVPNPLVPNPSISSVVIDHQAAVSFAEDITTDSLRKLSTYLDAHAERQPELATAVSIVSQASRCAAMRDYNQALSLIWQAYRVIAAARSTNTQLPPLRTDGKAANSPTPLN